MKTAKLLPILLIVLTLAFYSCKKSNPSPKVSNLMTFTLQGKKYTIATPYSVDVQGANFSINGVSQGGPGLAIFIDNYQQGTSFSLDDQAFVHLETLDAVGYGYTCDKGQLVISSLTQAHISGTFSGTAIKNDDNTYQEIPVNGTFDADIPQ